MNEIDKNDIKYIIKITSRYGCPNKREIASIYKLQKEKRLFKGEIGRRYLERLKIIYDSATHDGKCVICKKNSAVDGILCKECNTSVENAMENCSHDSTSNTNNQFQICKNGASDIKNVSKTIHIFGILFSVIILLSIASIGVLKFLDDKELKEHVSNPEIIHNKEIKMVNDFCRAIVSGDDENAKNYVANKTFATGYESECFIYFYDFFDQSRASIDYEILDENRSKNEHFEYADVAVMFTHHDISMALTQCFLEFAKEYNNEKANMYTDEKLADIFLKKASQQILNMPVKRTETYVVFSCIRNISKDEWFIMSSPDEILDVITCNYANMEENLAFYDSIGFFDDSNDNMDVSSYYNEEDYTFNENEICYNDEESFLEENETIYPEKVRRSGNYVNGENMIMIEFGNDDNSAEVSFYWYNEVIESYLLFEQGVMFLSRIDGEDYYYSLTTEEGGEYEILFGYDSIIVSTMNVEGGYYLEYYYQN